MKVLRPFLVAVALAVSLAGSVLADTTMEMPKFSGTPSGVFAALTTASPYLYIKTQYGFARVSVADPSNPSNGQLAQVGQKFVGGVMNGGVVGMSCDCWQGGTTMDTAEAADGSSRMVSDWIAGDQGLNGEVATGNGNGLSFGQQIDVDTVPLGSRVAAIALSSGKYVAYFPTQSNGAGGGISVVDVTSPTGSPSRNNGIKPFASLAWGNGSAVLLKAAYIGGKYLLAGAVRGDKTIRIAEIDPTTGIPTEKSSIVTLGTFASIALATVEGRTFVFAAQNANGLRVYEYANGALQAPFVLPGNFNEVVMRGGALPIMFLNSVVSSSTETYIEAWDTNWITRANGNSNAARRGAHIRHIGAPEKFIGAYDARVVGNLAYIYRITPFGGVTETVLQTTPVDLSALTVDPNSAPIASSSATNVSALQRVGAERAINYYGDRWEIEDTSASSSSPPANGLSKISWDFNYTGTFAADTGWNQVAYGGNSDISPAFFPCEPGGGGNIQTGAGCSASLGNPTAGGNYRYAVQTFNGVGPSNPAPSSPIAVAFPKVLIAGLNTSVSPALLQVLTGSGVADASGSQGNLADATFAWTFNPGGLQFSTAKVTNLPGNATSFALTITYKGGYTATQTGNISQVDLVPDFTPASGSIVVGGNLAITNKMQKGTGVTVNSVEYKWDSDASYTTLAGAFNAVNGQASVPAPPIGTSHTLTLRYNYSVGSSGKQVSVSHGPFTTVLNNLAVSVSASPSSGRTGQTISFTATVTGGSASTTLEWCWQDCLGGFGTFSVGPAANTHVYTTGGTKTATVRATDGSVQAYGSTTVTISGSGGGGGGTPSVNLSGPTTGVVNQSVAFNAAGSGGTPPYSFSWCWEACSLGGTFAAGPSANSHTFTTTGPRTVVVQIRDSASKTNTDSLTITINTSGGGGGGGGGSLAVSISGPSSGKTGTPLSYTANVSGGTAPYSYSWCWEACSLGGTFTPGPATNSHTYTSAGNRSLAVQVSDSKGNNETDTQPVSISGSGGNGNSAPSGTYTVVSGADVNPFNGSYSGSVGTPITLSATETHAATWAWDFGDSTTGSGQSVTHTYASGGSYTITLTVTGDGTNTQGTSSTNKDFSISGPVFSAVAVPDAANIATSDGVWKTDVSVTNSGPTEISITPIFVTYESLNARPSPLDVTSLGFSSANKYTIPPGGTWSQANVVDFLQGTGKGNLFIQTEGGLFPDVAARVYFEPNDPTVGTFGNAVSAFRIGASGQVGVEAIRALNPQTIVGVRSDDQLRFKLKLYNSSGGGGSFRVTAFDETGTSVPIQGAQFLDVGINAYQAPEFSGEDLGLTDPTHRYVLQAQPISQGGMLIASVSVIDRTTNDQVRLADDATRPGANAGVVTAFVPGASRFDTATAHWRTSISMENAGSQPRDVTVDYIYGAGKIATYERTLAPGELASFDDISQLYPNVPEIATETGTSGLLRVHYAADGEESSKPVYVNARSYDDRSSTTGGTAGTALAVYAASDAIGPGDSPLVITAVEVSDRFRTNVGVFAVDDSLAIAKITALDKDGNVLGVVDGVALNNTGVSGPWSQFPISVLSGLPTDPVSLRVEVKQGRAVAYAINVDQKSQDTTFIRATE
ncbi:MAG TPA: PKD domain-containing protein [Thermoanaerobaculia bacterium]